MNAALLFAYALILIGIGLIILELFFFVGGSVLFGLGLALIGIGVFLTFREESPVTGYVTLVLVFVGTPILIGAALRYSPKGLRQRIFLHGPDEDATIASMPVNLELESLRGHFGKTVSPLRPGGLVDFDGRRVDCLTEGMMIETGQWVRCIEVKPGRVIVRLAPKPDIRDLEKEF